ncbi:MAG: VOC family protein [Burkholderiales bacterium]|nr:VOC family protein [Burkholderiales bacterium]
MPVQILGLDHIVLRVADLRRMTRFYCDVLGCRVERVREELGLTHLRAGEAMIDLVAVEGELGRRGGPAAGPTGRNVDHFCLRVEPFDAAVLLGHFAAHGVAAGEVKMRFGAEGMGPSLYLTDPEGNVVELKGGPERGAGAPA